MYRSGFTIAPARPDAAYEAILSAAEQRLRKADAHNLLNDGTEVRFTGGFFRILSNYTLLSNWNLLYPITKGSITVDRQANRIKYELGFVQVVIVGILMTGFLDTCMAVGGKCSPSVICIASVFWFLWFAGMNYLISLARFDSFVKRCMRDAGFSVQRRKKEAVSS
jgi:hypothetical protein